LVTDNWQIIILSIAAIIFLFIYSWYPYQVAKDTDFKFASPDETANYFWAKNYAAGLGLTYFEPLNLIADDAVTPRSVRSDNGTVKPVSFLGIILIYGWLAKTFGPWIIIYLTPLFAVIGIFCFYGITRRVFNDKIALLSALMLFALVPYWYYAARSMFHNVLFIDLLLIGIYFLIDGTRIEQMKRIKTDFIFIFLSGIFFGLAIMTRASELIWLAPVMLITWLAVWRFPKPLRGFGNLKDCFLKLFIFAFGLILALLPMFYYNQVLYGGWFKFGYNRPAAVEAQSKIAVNNVNAENINGIASSPRSAVDLLAMTKRFMPAQINIKQAGKSFINYYAIMFWHLFWPAFFGGIWLLYNWKKIDNPQKLYLVVFIISSMILGLYYGSWKIQDNPNPASFTIGNSYTRYFLPMYIMSLPLAALLIIKLSSLLSFPRKRESRVNYNEIPAFAGMTVLIVIFLILNFQAAVWGKEEGLLTMKNNLVKDAELVESMFSHIEPEAIIISERFDKFLWPKYKVIIGNLSDKSHPQAYAELAEQGIPLYYYGFIFPPGDFAYLNSRKLAEVNLELEIIKLDEESRIGLYKLQVTSNK